MMALCLGVRIRDVLDVSELLKLRDNYLYFSGSFHLDQSDIEL